MAKDDERCSFPARTAAWPDVRGFVEARCSEMGLPRAAALRLELIAEELFINAAEHGHAGDGRPVWIALREAADEVELIVEDSAPAFNPFADVAAPSSSTDPDRRPVGGLGRALVVSLSCRCDYLRTDRGNRVTVAVLKVARVVPGPS